MTDREPLSDLAADVEKRRERDRPAFDDAFVEVDAAVDSDDPWEDLSSEEDLPAVVAEREDGADRDVRVVPKRTCHGCPHLDEPPDLGCANEGTDILELVGVDRFRVADCPMVVDEGDLSGIDGEATEPARVRERDPNPTRERSRPDASGT